MPSSTTSRPGRLRRTHSQRAHAIATALVGELNVCTGNNLGNKLRATGTHSDAATVSAGGKLTPLRRLKMDPPEARGGGVRGRGSLARSLSPRPGDGACWTWSAGPSCDGSTSCVACRSRISCAAMGSAATRSAALCAPISRRAMSVSGGRPSSIPSRRRSTSSCAPIRSCRACASAS